MATIRDFDELKIQLTELAKVVNAFKSEAVQLRVVEIVLSEFLGVSISQEHEIPKTRSSNRKKLSPKRKTKSASTPEIEGKKSKARAIGPATILSSLIDENFFSKHQTLNSIIEHAKTKKATTLKPNELSGPIARFVRDGRLKREKNNDGQYEYFT
ncbi:MAG: hypothetical protein DPW18_01335 [Chloroflexi bacterium]|nr:hypothetical protein [Chloroflexota bacterium]MDL1940850.1 hypothetical protein [Chloroflexi bacterium CFX2]